MGEGVSEGNCVDEWEAQVHSAIWNNRNNSKCARKRMKTGKSDLFVRTDLSHHGIKQYDHTVTLTLCSTRTR